MLIENLLAVDQGPDAKGMLLLCILPLALALGAWAFARTRDRSDLIYRLRWLAVIPLAIGLVLGVRYSYLMATDLVYQQYFQLGPRMMILHYAAAILPILGIIALVVWNRMDGKQDRYDF